MELSPLDILYDLEEWLYRATRPSNPWPVGMVFKARHHCGLKYLRDCYMLTRRLRAERQARLSGS